MLGSLNIINDNYADILNVTIELKKLWERWIVWVWISLILFLLQGQVGWI